MNNSDFLASQTTLIKLISSNQINQ